MIWSVPCPHAPQDHMPEVIVGMDNFPKILEVLGLVGQKSETVVVSRDDVAAAGRRTCARKWTEILQDFPGFMPYRAQRACFGAAYIYALMGHLYGMATDLHIKSGVDAFSTTTITKQIPEFVAVDTVDSQELGWPLGAAAFAALYGEEPRPFTQP